MITWPVTQRFVFSQSTEQTVPKAKANSPLKAPVDVIVFSVGRLIVPFSCSSMVYSVRAFLGAGFLDELFLFFWGSSSDSTMSSSSSSSSDSDEDSFSNSEPSFDWPSSYFGADARLARLGRDALVLGPARGTLRRSARRGSACDETWDCADCARARTSSETARQIAALLRHVRAPFRALSRARWQVSDAGAAQKAFLVAYRSLRARSAAFFAEAREWLVPVSLAIKLLFFGFWHVFGS